MYTGQTHYNAIFGVIIRLLTIDKIIIYYNEIINFGAMTWSCYIENSIFGMMIMYSLYILQ